MERKSRKKKNGISEPVFYHGGNGKSRGKKQNVKKGMRHCSEPSFDFVSDASGAAGATGGATVIADTAAGERIVCWRIGASAGDCPSIAERSIVASLHSSSIEDKDIGDGKEDIIEVVEDVGVETKGTVEAREEEEEGEIGDVIDVSLLVVAS